ncbi:MAG TPA: hypothetical protein PLU78_02290, partial [Chitinophagales bacterium]|nr:hypothetical protein [Chitinophagales bacterium]
MSTVQMNRENVVSASGMSLLHKKWRRYKYFLPLIVIPGLMYISFHYLGYWSFFAFGFVYGFIPVAE